MRECGGCTQCCYLVGVPELEKSDSEQCLHCDEGWGCAVYEKRPQSCQDFNCLWLTEFIPEHLKPDKIKTVVMLVVGQSRGGDRLPIMLFTIDEKAPINAELHSLGVYISHQTAVQFTHGERRQMWQNGKLVAEWNKRTQHFDTDLKDGKFVDVTVTDRIAVEEVVNDSISPAT